MTDLVWTVIVVVGIAVAYGLGRRHERDRRRGRVAPVVPLRRPAVTNAVWHHGNRQVPVSDGASQVRIVAAPRAYDWQKRDGGVR